MRRITSLIVLLGFISTAAVAADGVREVQYDDHAVIPIQAHLRVSTTIVLPDDETILDFICGDKDYWVINGAHNIAHVKPAKAGAWTNLQLVATSGHIYTFRLQEGGDAPDFKVFVTLPAGAARTPHRFYSTEEVEQLRSQLTDAQAAAGAAKRAATEAIEAQRVDYPTRMHFDYRFDRDKKPFAVTEIWHDGASTFIRCGARELPALYEEKDGTPNLVNYQVRAGGTYVIAKVLDRGYLMIGKDKLTFQLATD